MKHKEVSLSELLGMTLTSVEQDGEEAILFASNTGRTFMMYHRADCCEDVRIEDVVGDLHDLVGHPILLAEVAESGEHPLGCVPYDDPDSFTWTFYKLATIKGYVDIRWYGTSNGYYSEAVDFVEVLP